MSARRPRLTPGRLPLSDAALGRLTVAKAKALYRVRHPNVERELRDLDRRPYCPVCGHEAPGIRFTREVPA